MTDHELQAAYAELLKTRVSDQSLCPAPERIRALVERSAPEPERLATLDHVMSCSSCRREFDLLNSFGAGLPRPRRPYLVPLAAAAVVALLFTGTMVFVALRAPAEGSDTLRGPSQSTELVAPRGESGGRPVTFIWRSAGPGAHYTLEVFTSEGDVVFSAESNDTVAALPDQTPLASGVRYHWWVAVRTRTGQEYRTRPETFTP